MIDRIIDGVRTAEWLKTRSVGAIHTPAFPRHGAVDECPFCGEWYRRHAGFVDHRDECDPTVPTKRGNNDRFPIEVGE